MTSLVYKYEGIYSYITRESLSVTSTSGRGISHIFATPDAEMLYVGGCIDPIVSATSINTDHHIVVADFDFNLKHRTQEREAKSDYNYQWGTVANILVAPSGNLADAKCPPTINLKLDTPRTELFRINRDLFDRIQNLTEEGSELNTKYAEPFWQDIQQLQFDLKAASSQLHLSQQNDGILVPRKDEYKMQLDSSVLHIMEGLQTLMTLLKLKKADNPNGRVAANINRVKRWKDDIKKDRANITFSKAIHFFDIAIANSKALRRTAGKILLLSPDTLGYKTQMKQVLFYLKRLQEVSHEIDLDRILQNAIDLADHQQQEREIIENTLSKHRNLNKYQGGGSTRRTTPLYNPSTIQHLNRILKKAGVYHLLDTNLNETQNASLAEDEDSHAESSNHGWCKIVEWLEEAET
jgi:hypothetical protein